MLIVSTVKISCCRRHIRFLTAVYGHNDQAIVSDVISKVTKPQVYEDLAGEDVITLKFLILMLLRVELKSAVIHNVQHQIRIVGEVVLSEFPTHVHALAN